MRNSHFATSYGLALAEEVKKSTSVRSKPGVLNGFKYNNISLEHLTSHVVVRLVQQAMNLIVVLEPEAAWLLRCMSMRPTGTPFSRVRSPHSQSEGPDLIQANETNNAIILADESGYKSTSEDDRFLDWVEYSASPMHESSVQSNLYVETA